MSGARNELSPQAALPQLEITDGLHHGVRMALEQDEYSIGLSTECDIVLRDEGVRGHHAVLRIEGGEVRVEAVGGDVTVGKLKVATGQGCRARLPVAVAIGGATLQLRPAPGSTGALAAIASMNQPTKLAGGVLLCALAAVVATNGMSHPDPSAGPIAEASTLEQNFSETQDAAPVGAAAPAVSTAGAAKTAAEELSGKLKEAGIGTLNVNADDERIVVEGRLSDQQASAWTGVQRWFDAKFGTTVLTANVAVGALAGPAPVRLQAIWFGQRPYIITDNGSRYYEGAMLDSGWIVQRIAEDRVILQKETETLALTYR